MSNTTQTHHAPRNPKGAALAKLSIGALGVVYGDIGTSPLYALKESFHPGHGIPLTPDAVMGILSLVFWSLMLVVTMKYLMFILRADNHGEGGITALLALLIPKIDPEKKQGTRAFVVTIGLLGAGLLYGDGIITPAISVLSAVEGIKVATPAFEHFIVPVTILILIVLFYFQKGGTAKIGAVFGPITLLWFITIAAIGVPWIIKHPEILRAVYPKYAIRFFMEHGMPGFLILSSVVLCITGGEALYADMGHFGRKPIRYSWLLIVLPALLLNYFGQGALILEKGNLVLENTFYELVSGWMLYPLVVIATLATVIASQALISGAFSLTQQSVQLGFLPRTKINHTSRETEGQIYVPKVNLALMIACIALVLIYRESTNLAAAYGIAVTATMLITSILFFLVSRIIWRWKLPKALLITSIFVVIDTAFLAANTTKIANGGWVPIVIALAILAIMTTWKKGRMALAKEVGKNAVTLDEFFAKLDMDQPFRVKGTAVFMTLNSNVAPSVLLHHYRHNKTLHEKVVLLSIVSENSPEIPGVKKVRVTDLSHGFIRVVARYGYIETPSVREILNLCASSGAKLDYDKLSYYLGRETFVTTGNSGMSAWRKRLFIFLSRNSGSASEFFKLPPDRVIELGSQIEI